MKVTKSLNWLRRQEDRLRRIKLTQRRKIASEIPQLTVSSATMSKTKSMSRARHILFRRGTILDYRHKGTFQEAIRPLLVLCQVFGLMPVSGITSDDVRDLRFSWKNVRTFYSLLVLAGLFACWGFNIAYASKGRLDFDSFETIIFYTSSCLIACAFLSIAYKWPALLRQWHSVEQKLPPLHSEKDRSLLAYRIKMLTLIATACSLVEHLLSMLSIIYYVNACPVMPGHPIESFLHTSFNQYFYFFDYSAVAGIIGKIVNVYSTFAWNFNDIFVMAVSVALAARFRQLNEHMLRAVKRPTTEQFWIHNRLNYRSLCRLCEAADDTISVQTMLSLSSNLYFVCVKILKSLQKKPTMTHTVYFWYSLIYLLGRTLFLSLCTAQINDESKRPLVAFRSISREFWCPELKRFSEEVSTDVVALTGMKFFHLTRSMVISVAGTIVTYELILMQFNKQDKVNDCYEN